MRQAILHVFPPCTAAPASASESKLFQADSPLEQVDPEMFGIIASERSRQVRTCFFVV